MPSNPSTNRAAGPRLSLYERRRTVWGALVGLLVLDAILVFFTLRPSGLSLPQQKAELARLNIDLKGRHESLAHLEHVQATLADSSRQGDEFVKTKFLPVATGFSTIMEEVDKLAVANGVRKGPVSYGYQEIKDRPGLATVEINLSLEGEYAKIVRFINQFEQSPLFLIVDSLGVARGEGRGVRLSVKLVTYFRDAKGSQ